MKYSNFFLVLITFSIIAEKNTVLLTLPKTGTNLVLKFLKIVLNEKTPPNINGISKTLYWGHDWKIGKQSITTLEPNAEKIALLTDIDTKLILLLRDPRQHIIALLRAIKKPINFITIEWGIQNFPYMLMLQTKQKSFLQYKDINECYDAYLQWASDYPATYIVSFEKLIGPKGGGNQAAQLKEIGNMMQFLVKETSDREISNIASNLFGGTSTFKEGKIDSWKRYYSNENKRLFKEKAGPLLIKLGYEKDNNW